MGWNRKPIELAKELRVGVDDLRKKAARSFLKHVYDLSPIKSGRYKSNHIVSIGAPSYQFDARRRDFSKWYAEGLAAINNSPRGAKIYIQQNLPYAQVIENGSSTQAPSGVYKIAYMRVKL